MEDWNKGLDILRKTLAGEPNGFEWFDKEIATLTYLKTEQFRLRPKRLGFDGQHLHLEAATFGVQDVAGAAELCDRILNHRHYGSPAYHPSDEMAAQYALQKTCDERLELIESLQRHINDIKERQTMSFWAKRIGQKLTRFMSPKGLRAFRSK